MLESVGREWQEPQAGLKRGSAGFSFVCKAAEPMAVPIYGDLHAPSLMGLVPINTAKSGRATVMRSPILHVPSMGHESQIAAPVVNPVAVDVIDLATICRLRQLHQHAMHEERLTVCVGTRVSLAGHVQPAEGLDYLNITCVDQRVANDVPIAGQKWNACGRVSGGEDG